MADMNYVSPLTSDLTDYYTKSEVDELQQGDAATYATSAEIVAGDNAVKGWVISQGFLTEHQDLTNYATISYVDDAIAAIEPSSGGMAVRVVSTLPGVGEENVLYLVFVDNEDEDNRYAEYIWVDALNDYEMLGYGSSEGGIIPDLTDYATKQWVEAKGYLVSSDLGDFATKDYVDDELANKANSADLATVATSGRYEDLIDKPTIPSLTGYATEAYVNNAVSGITIPDVSDFIDAEEAQSIAADEVEYKMGGLSTVAVSGSYNDLTDKPVIPAAPDLSSYATKAELSAKANTADLAAVASTGSYNDLTNKPSIPTVPTNISAFTNDADYLTNNDAASIFTTQTDFLTKIGKKANTADLSTVATSGSYNDLTDKPTIPAAPDLTPYATKAELTAKADAASLASVATSGDYDDLLNKPTIPTSGIDGVGNGSLASLLMLLSSVNDNNTRAMLTVNPTTIAEFEEAFKKGILIYLYGRSLDITSSQFSSTNGFTWYQFNNASKTYLPRTTTVNSLGSANYYLKLTDNTGLSLYQGNQGYGTEGLRKAIFRYVNTTSGLTATTFQEAIDELAASSGGASTAAQLSYDNTNTWNDGTDTDTVQEAIDSLWNDVDNNMTNISDITDRLDNLPPGYEISETFDATNKSLTLSVVASRS